MKFDSAIFRNRQLSIGVRERPLDNIARIVEQVQAHESAYGDWFYPPLEPASFDAKETKNSPLVPTSIFSLPATHVLSFKNQDWTDESANFMIALFGMIKGRRLQRDGWTHFYSSYWPKVVRFLCRQMGNRTCSG